MVELRRRFVWSLAIVLFCCSITLAAGRREKPDQVEDVKIGAEVPNFVLKDVNGKTIALRQLRGNPVVLTFWASWCPACRAELPSLEALHARMARQGVVVLGVNGGEPLERVTALMANLHLTFPVAMDVSGEVHALYRVTQYPVTFIIDRDGLLIERRVGSRDWNSPQVVHMLKSLLGEEMK